MRGPILVSYKEAEVSELVGLEFESDEQAYQAYRRYAYVKCFGIRNDCLRRNIKGDIVGRVIVCCKHGRKANKGSLGKDYTKLDRRTNCKAMAVFKVVDGKLACVRHDMIHNHDFCHPNEVHNLRCHREVTPSEVEYLVHLRSSGVRLSDAIRCMVKEAGGSPAVGFGYADAASAVNKAMKKKFDGTDCNTFINLLKQRAANEEDFYYDFELDEDNCLVSVFFRDKKMRDDYEAFPELLGNDGTYCTNKYEMICAPFVGINQHTKICMFGIGFMLNERIDSFKWLYSTFLASMGGIQPKTIMTDQCAAMAAAIKHCFPESKHRLCIWHLFKNSSSHLGSLKEKKGFHKLFNRIMKRCHTEAELKYCWDRYDCMFLNVYCEFCVFLYLYKVLCMFYS